MKTFDLVVLGAGPGGYVAAIRAAQLGMKVAVVEQERAGGVCLNWGCIPSKSILDAAELFETLALRGASYGIEVDGLRCDYSRVIARSRHAADQLAKGVEGLFKKNGVTLVPGRGALTAPNRVHVVRDGDGEALEARNVLLATGSTERTLPGLEVDGQVVMTSRQALERTELPRSIVIIGGGAVGVEFASVYNSFGVGVTLVEMEGQLLPGTDGEIAAELHRQFRRRGVTMRVATRFQSCRRTDSGVEIEVRTAAGASATLPAEQVLVAVGRAPLSREIGLEQVGVRTERGFVAVDRAYRTSVPTVFAIGDLIGPPLLAHKASTEGIAAAENMAREHPRMVDYTRIPACVYSQPEVASVGLTEQQAREHGHRVRIGKVPFRAIGKAVATGHTEGFVKLVIDEHYGAVLGCHIVGKGATDLVAEVGLAMTLESTSTEVADTVHAHPTLSEAIMEAALNAEGRSINF